MQTLVCLSNIKTTTSWVDANQYKTSLGWWLFLLMIYHFCLINNKKQSRQLLVCWYIIQNANYALGHFAFCLLWYINNTVHGHFACLMIYQQKHKAILRFDNISTKEAISRYLCVGFVGISLKQHNGFVVLLLMYHQQSKVSMYNFVDTSSKAQSVL